MDTLPYTMDTLPYTHSSTPLPQRHLSVKFIAASIRRSRTFSSVVATYDKATVVSPGMIESRNGPKRPNSLFSWRTQQRSSSAIKQVVVEMKHIKTRAGDLKKRHIVSSKGSLKNRRDPKELPPLPTLLIKFDSLHSTSSTFTSRSPLTNDRFEEGDSYFPPSLPDLRQSTFQPLDLESFPSASPSSPSPASLPHPRSPLEVRKQLSLRGPFPNRPRTLIIASFPSPPLPIVTSSSPSIERPLRIDTLPRPAFVEGTTSPGVSPRTRCFPTRPPLTRPSSFTLSLPTVTEASRRQLRPISIAPRTTPSPSVSSSPTFPSTPHSGYSTRSSSVTSFSSAHAYVNETETHTPMKVEPVEPISLKDKVDWSEVEKTLRDLSEERLKLLMDEVKRVKL